MIITEELKTAIFLACEEAGSQSAFARLIGIKHQNINRYLNGQVKEITPQILAKLWPKIQKFMPKDTAFEPNFACETRAEILASNNIFQGSYEMYKLMMQTFLNIGPDSLFFHVMIYWSSMSEEQKKEIFKHVAIIAETSE